MYLNKKYMPSSVKSLLYLASAPTTEKREFQLGRNKSLFVLSESLTICWLKTCQAFILVHNFTFCTKDKPSKIAKFKLMSLFQ